MLRFVDLFSGIGGIRKGLETAAKNNGLQATCVFSCEIDPQAKKTYEINYGEVPYGDIRTVASLPEHDILLAGFPCQSFSYAGKQKGFADTRGTLFFEIERLLRGMKKKPGLMLLENVRGFTTHDKGRTYETVLAKLKALGYSVSPLLLNSSNFGVPQNRVRVYLVCSLDTALSISIKSDVGAPDSHKFKSRHDLFNWEKNIKCVRDILEENTDNRFLCSEKFITQLAAALNGKPFENLHGIRLIDYRGGNSIHSWELGTKGKCSKEECALMNSIISNRRKKHFGEDKDGKKLSQSQIKTFWTKNNLDTLLDSLVQKGYLKLVDGKYNPTCGNMSFEVFKFLDPNSISITIVASDAHRLGIVQNGLPRRITPRECARLQGFPDDFILHPSDSWAYRQLGNSVSVPVVTAIFDELLQKECQTRTEIQQSKRRKAA